LYSSPNITREIKTKKMRWAGHVVRIGVRRNAYRVLVRKPDGKRPDRSCRLDERITMKLISNKQDLRSWTELIWLGI
jgi:hypothetical protein